jgi:hypothetical protein
MRVSLGATIQRVLRFLHLTPLSLAAKCRIMFGLAVLLCLATALLIPYIWMGQLKNKVLLDTHRMKAESVLLWSHFRLESSGEIRWPELDDRGTAQDRAGAVERGPEEIAGGGHEKRNGPP